MNYAINPQDIYTSLNQKITFIDIRDSLSFDQLHIKSFINLPDEQALSYPFNKSYPIWIICYSGIKSQSLCLKLRSLGFDAYYIQGGFYHFLNTQPSAYF